MTVICGDASAWRVNLLAIQDVILTLLIPDAWPRCQRICAGKELHEDKVTHPFIKTLRTSKSSLRHKFEHVKFRIEPFVGVNPGDSNTGFTDIHVIPMYDNEEIYLAYECKWLEKTEHNLSGFCGKEGIGRFTSGKYAAQVNVGNMIGYVFSGEIEKAERNILSYMQKNGLPIPSSVGKNLPNMCVLRSRHQRAVIFGDIEITHILLPYIAVQGQ
mgnify:CR=1 FL=1